MSTTPRAAVPSSACTCRAMLPVRRATACVQEVGAMRNLILILALASCGKSDAPKATGSAPASAGDLKGTWSGTWQRKEIAGGGPLVLTLGEHPTLKRTGTACPPEETPVTVTTSGDQV